MTGPGLPLKEGGSRDCRCKPVKVKLILPALTEATSPHWRPIKYSLFPPLGLSTLAAYLDPDDEVEIVDEHVEPPRANPTDPPDLVAIEVYVTSAYRAYAIADEYRRRGSHVALGGIHVTSLPDEAARHADTVFLGPGEDTWPAFLDDFRAKRPGLIYRSTARTLVGAPWPRRDLIRRSRYLVPNSIVVSRGCPHNCRFCYKDAFYGGAGQPAYRSHYTRAVDDALAEVDTLPGRHLYFLDDHLFGSARFARGLFSGLSGMGRVWQAGATVESVLRPGLLEAAAASGLRSLFVGFETLSARNLADQGKRQNLGRDYALAVRRLHDLGVMVNASFVFGLDDDDESVFDRTVGWAIEQGIETATFHILTPYPGTALHSELSSAGRVTSSDWDRYDTRHVVYQPARLTPEALEAGYWRAYRDFYAWGSILSSARVRATWRETLRHVAYVGAWKRAEPVWDLVIRARALGLMLPLLEGVLGNLSAPGRRSSRESPALVPADPAR